jgi:hypothetical protein
LKSFNYIPYLFSKKVEKTALYRDNFFSVCGLCTVHVGVRTCTLYRVYIYGREYRMRRNRNGRNVQLGPESIATLPPFGPIEGQKWFDQISSQ